MLEIDNLIPLSPVFNTNAIKSNHSLKHTLLPRYKKGLLLFLSITVLSYFISYDNQYSYATSDQPQIRTLSIKVHLEKGVVHQGEFQTIHYHVVDEKSLLPVGGAITTATITYAGGATTRQASEQTDDSGDSAISFRIGRNAPLGTYTTFYSVFEAGYVRESGSGNSFSVVTQPVIINQTNIKINNTDTSGYYALPNTDYIQAHNSLSPSSTSKSINDLNQTGVDNNINADTSGNYVNQTGVDNNINADTSGNYAVPKISPY
ncbi:MAG TPA: hypothetical protein VH500_01525 [Nitrososphaeraceae archaeon]